MKINYILGPFQFFKNKYGPFLFMNFLKTNWTPGPCPLYPPYLGRALFNEWVRGKGREAFGGRTCRLSLSQFHRMRTAADLGFGASYGDKRILGLKRALAPVCRCHICTFTLLNRHISLPIWKITTPRRCEGFRVSTSRYAPVCSKQDLPRPEAAMSVWFLGKVDLLDGFLDRRGGSALAVTILKRISAS